LLIKRSNNAINSKTFKKLIEAVRRASRACNRSLSGQIEHWAKIGKLSEENPDLTYKFAKDILKSMSEDEAGMREPYRLES